MFDRILFPTDGGEGAAAAFDHVLDVAAGHDAEVVVLHVADTTHDSVVQVQGEVVDVFEREGEQLVEELADRARDRAVAVATEILQGGPAATIVDYASETDIDLIAMPTAGRQGLERLFVGSTTERVLRRATVPVLTIRPDEVELAAPYRSYLVPTDGSESATAALDLGASLAVHDDAALHLLSVVEYPALAADGRVDVELDMLEDSAEEILDDAVASVEDRGIERIARAIEYGSAVHEAILDYVDDHEIDVIVIGTEGLSGLDRYLLGSVAESVIRTAPVPVLAVREGTATLDK